MQVSPTLTAVKAGRPTPPLPQTSADTANTPAQQSAHGKHTVQDHGPITMGVDMRAHAAPPP